MTKAAPRRPPFTHALNEIIAERTTWSTVHGSTAEGLSVFVMAGSAAWDTARQWSRLRHRVAFTMMPPGEDPAAFDWRILSLPEAQPILVRPCGELARGDLAALVRAILRDGADRALFRQELFERGTDG